MCIVGEREREREMLDLLNEELALGLDSVYKWNLILGENGQMPFSKKKKNIYIYIYIAFCLISQTN